MTALQCFSCPLEDNHGPAWDLLVSRFCTFSDSATKTEHGHLQAVEKMAKDFKARMTVRLAVAGAFHTHFMKPAEEKLRCAPLTVDSNPPAPQLYNVLSKLMHMLLPSVL